MKKFFSILKKKEIDVIILLAVLVSLISLFILVDSNDEIWNFANSYKIYNGYKIYEQINIIVTPLFFYIAQIFFKIFGPTILTFRIYNIAVSTIFLILIYFIFKSLNIVKRRAAFYTILITFILNGMIAAGANYNIMAIFPILITIILILNKKENPILFGILLFLTFMIKQNIYIIFAIGLFIYIIVNKKNIKDIIGSLLKIYITSIIGIIIYCLYLYLNNNLYNFINYCFLGIGEFGNKNLAIEFSGARYIYISIIAIVLSFFIMYNKKINIKMEKDVINNIKTLLSFGIPLLIMAFPIINYYHATLASVIIFIEFIYIIENMLVKELQIDIKKEKKVYIVAIILYIVYLLINMYLIILQTHNEKIVLNNQGAYYGSFISKENYEDIEIICKYIKEQEKNNVDVKILSYKANSYMIELNKNNGKFDLAFLGNLGSKGEKGLIDEIKNMSNTLILIQTDCEKMFYQESKIARDYIINNYEKIGEIQEYSIYYIK